jgi:hypothetical protein
MPRLKVFTWSDGLHAYTVAASSRAKALAAWGFSRDLFKTGEAQEITAGGDHDRALANPGEMIERGLKVDVGKIRAIKPPPAKPASDALSPPPGPSKADLARVARLQADLEALTKDHDAKAGALDREREALDAKAAAQASAFRAKRRALEDKLKLAQAKAAP